MDEAGSQLGFISQYQIAEILNFPVIRVHLGAAVLTQNLAQKSTDQIFDYVQIRSYFINEGILFPHHCYCLLRDYMEPSGCISRSAKRIVKLMVAGD